MFAEMWCCVSEAACEGSSFRTTLRMRLHAGSGMDILPSRINHNQVWESAAALTRCSGEGGGGGRGARASDVIVMWYCLAPCVSFSLFSTLLFGVSSFSCSVTRTRGYLNYFDITSVFVNQMYET